MIHGLIPIGGKGLRLGLPYSKEMLPQKNFDVYNPVVNHLVQKMLLAGAECITFVHGLEYKDDVKEYFSSSQYNHILQSKLGFANVIKDFGEYQYLTKGDKILFGLPDSIFNSNPFIEMLNVPGIVCGCFTTDDYSKVDRLDLDSNFFQIKTPKTSNNQNKFWGVIKFEFEDIKLMLDDKVFDTTSEIGDLLNKYGFKFVEGEQYIDLGTWEGYNRYLLSDEIGINNEIEKKYDAINVSKELFADYFSLSEQLHITSPDHYFTINNPNVEFLRYREDSNDEGAVPDLTIKNYNSSYFNRFELTIPISKQATKHNVIHFLSLIGAKYEFEVSKDCVIVNFDNLYTIVFYEFKVLNETRKIIEIELHKGDLNLLKKAEASLQQLEGFDPSKVITKSKFQLVKEIYDSSH